MNLPDLDPSGGPLEVKDVLIEYDGPQLFTARNRGGSLYFALHGPHTYAGDNWLFARTSHHRIRQVLEGAASLRSAMTRYAFGDVAIATLADGHWMHEFLDPNLVPEEYLPEEGVLITQRSHKSEIYDAFSPNNEEDYFRVPVSTYRDMWEFDPQTIDFLKENITPLYVVARRRQRLVADLVLADGEAKHDIPLPDLSKILLSLQKTVDSLAAPEFEESWKPSRITKAETRLDAIAAFPSSFGLRIEAHQGALADEGAGALAFRRLIDLLTSVKDLDTLRSTLALHSTSTKLQFGKLVESIAKSGNSIRISASTGMSEDVDETRVSNERLTWLNDKISEINERDFRDIRVTGHLKAISLKTRFFLIENSDETYSGRISEEFMPHIPGMTIDEVYIAKIRIRQSVHELTGEIDSKSTLMNLKPLN